MQDRNKFTYSSPITRVLKSILLVQLAFFAFGCNHADNSVEKQPSASASNSAIMETAEYKMAIIDAGHVLATDDPAINKFQTLLTKIQEVYPGMEPKQYSSGAVAAKNELAKMGISVSLMEIMQAVSEVPKVSAKDDFPGAVTAYATLRSQGATHDEAVKGMQQVAKAVRRNQRQ